MLDGRNDRQIFFSKNVKAVLHQNTEKDTFDTLMDLAFGFDFGLQIF